MVRLNTMRKGNSVLNLPDYKMHFVILCTLQIFFVWNWVGAKSLEWLLPFLSWNWSERYVYSLLIQVFCVRTCYFPFQVCGLSSRHFPDPFCLKHTSTQYCEFVAIEIHLHCWYASVKPLFAGHSVPHTHSYHFQKPLFYHLDIHVISWWYSKRFLLS